MGPVDVLRNVNRTFPAFSVFGTPLNLKPEFWSPLIPIVTGLDDCVVLANAAIDAATTSTPASARTANALRLMLLPSVVWLSPPGRVRQGFPCRRGRIAIDR